MLNENGPDLPFASPILIVLILIIVINVNINYRPASIGEYGDTLNSDLVNELHGLEHAMTNNQNQIGNKQPPR